MFRNMKMEDWQIQKRIKEREAWIEEQQFGLTKDFLILQDLERQVSKQKELISKKVIYLSEMKGLLSKRNKELTHE